MIKTDIALAGNAASNIRVQDRERRMSLFNRLWFAPPSGIKIWILYYTIFQQN